jgi:hypothetical protein
MKAKPQLRRKLGCRNALMDASVPGSIPAACCWACPCRSSEVRGRLQRVANQHPASPPSPALLVLWEPPKVQAFRAASAAVADSSPAAKSPWTLIKARLWDLPTFVLSSHGSGWMAEDCQTIAAHFASICARLVRVALWGSVETTCWAGDNGVMASSALPIFVSPECLRLWLLTNVRSWQYLR